MDCAVTDRAFSSDNQVQNLSLDVNALSDFLTLEMTRNTLIAFSGFDDGILGRVRLNHHRTASLSVDLNGDLDRLERCIALVPDRPFLMKHRRSMPGTLPQLFGKMWGKRRDSD